MRNEQRQNGGMNGEGDGEEGEGRRKRSSAEAAEGGRNYPELSDETEQYTDEHFETDEEEENDDERDGAEKGKKEENDFAKRL